MIARSLSRLGRVRRLATRLRRDTGGLALVEFALSVPIMLTLGLYGLEAANLALVNMRISQITSNLGDTASRIGLETTTLKQIRETDIDDAFTAVRLQGGGYNVANSGRFILSSLEQNSSGGQWIHWQRCYGQGNFASSFGVQGTGATGTSFAGMGPTGSEITAPPQQSVMFVEAFYVYKPLISSRLFGTPTIHTFTSFIVRDVRNLVDPNDPVNDVTQRMTCDRFTNTVP